MRPSLLQQRHSAFFAELVDEAHAAVLGPEQPAWLAVLDAEAANWSAALRRLLAQAQVDRAAQHGRKPHVLLVVPRARG